MLSVEGLRARAALFRYVRDFFGDRQFIEVDTPIRQPVLIPEHTIVPVPSSGWFLQTSPEQCMKRLLAHGCEKIFQICPCFRREEQGRRHLVEFTMLEWYRRGGDYDDLMTDCEGLISYVFERFVECGELPGITGGWLGKVSLEPPWERLTVGQAFDRYSPISAEEALRRDSFEEHLVEFVEPHLGVRGPTFLVDYPAQLASLARLKPEQPAVAERFELYCDGMEIANGFSELTSVDEQRQRFMSELDLMPVEKFPQRQLPERFLTDLQGLDKAAGIALGLDRLFMLCLSVAEITDAITFSPADLD